MRFLGASAATWPDTLLPRPAEEGVGAATRAIEL